MDEDGTCSNNRCPDELCLSESKKRHANTKRLVPDSGWGWLVVFASFMIHLINDGVTLSLGELFEELLKKFKAGNGATSSILSVIIGTSLCTGPISGAMINVYGCRTVTIVGSLIAATFIALSSYVTNITGLVFTLGFGTGFGFGLSYLPALICITYYFDKYTSLATGIAVCGSGFGTIIFSSFFRISLLNIKIEQVFLVTSAIVLSCIVFSFFFRPLPADISISVDYQSSRVTQEATLLTGKQEQVVVTEQSTKFGVDKGETFSENCCCDETKTEPIDCVGLPEVKKNYVTITDKKKSRLQTEIENMLNELTNFASMKDPIFVLFVLSNFLISIGFDAPFVFIPILSKEKGIDQQSSTSLLSIIGSGNIVGRVMLTYICDSFDLNRLFFYSTCLCICGIVTIFSVLCQDVISLGIFCLIYGILISAYISFTSKIATDLFGAEKLTNVLGITLLFQGVAAFFGPPVAGLMCDYFRNYNPVLIFSGIVLVLSGLILYPIPLIGRRILHKRKTIHRTDTDEIKDTDIYKNCNTEDAVC